MFLPTMRRNTGNHPRARSFFLECGGIWTTAIEARGRRILHRRMNVDRERTGRSGVEGPEPVGVVGRGLVAGNARVVDGRGADQDSETAAAARARKAGNTGVVGGRDSDLRRGLVQAAQAQRGLPILIERTSVSFTCGRIAARNLDAEPGPAVSPVAICGRRGEPKRLGTLNNRRLHSVGPTAQETR